MIIVLDAGHGLMTPGKRTPDGMREYEFNRAVAKYAKEKLESYNHVEVNITHSDHLDVPLQTRTDFANSLKARCFVSIHANAYGRGWNGVGGIETYVYPSPTAEASRLAKNVQNELIKHTGLRNRGVKRANFHVLRETKMTSILVECGFMTNKHEATLLKSGAYRKLCAEAIVKGIASTYSLTKSTKLYRVQTGAFSNYENAMALLKKLKNAGFDAFIKKS
ncbi:N-acetylmuramoyl-L-alanine amidase [Bacillus pakistanensis]|uniref:N-acetylmuramoyl-L-alanine amidase n=1 Tax=Rossellomorea pakistanensis TaxID=992288 RepID=A0ABS2NDP1_9BACI|nr:N-acetylmuramoyl-L-alanine amidase [Bacillus pakistanensis]MBM7585976.1 N-acetylmuramoyl-L-alanine amidase [Bacillus pakistanensis]